MKVVFGLEVTDPNVFDVLDVPRAEVRLSSPFLHFSDPVAARSTCSAVSPLNS